jgi:hypothetical protein
LLVPLAEITGVEAGQLKERVVSEIGEAES